MKRFLCVIAILLMISGCQNDNTSISETLYDPIESEKICTIKWCLPECGLDEEIIDCLNEELHKDGCNYRIDLVQMQHSPEKLYSEQVCEYEKNNDYFDVVSVGYAFSNNVSAGYDFIDSGYFALIDDTSKYTLVPEKLWETVKVGGDIYTVPSLAFNDSGITFYFNKAYISEQQISNFGGNISELENMVIDLSATEEFVPIYYGVDYTDFFKSFPYTAKGGVLLDSSMCRAVNPYELNEFFEYARVLNVLYNLGSFGNRINFSKYDYRTEIPPKDFAILVSPVLNNEIYFEELEFTDMELISYSLPVYLENRVLYSMGVSANSTHKDYAFDFLHRLYSEPKYAEILYSKKGVETMSIGLSVKDIKSNYEKSIVSDFAGYELSQNIVNSELKDLLVLSFDTLCKSQNFDKTLSEINEALNDAGINDYIANINSTLEENK